MGLCFTKTYEIPITASSAKQFPPPPPPPPSLPPPPPLQPLPSLLPLPVSSQRKPKPSISPVSTSLTKAPSSALFGSILQKPMRDINSLFILEEELGRGQFGVTCMCTDRATGIKYACKSISKKKLVNRADIDDMRREVLILQHLTGQPNVVEFTGAYEDANTVYLVMELCSGGELFDRIIAKGNYSEQLAAKICRGIVNVVHVCHFMGVMHRDLKPENFLFVGKHEDSDLKAIDFGLSVFIEEGCVKIAHV